MVVMAPTASRPRFPGSYGIREGAEGLLDWSWAATRLETARNYWLCTSSASGAPHARPVWAVWLAERLCFSTDADSIKGRAIGRDPRVSVHLDSGDEVVILDGIAEALPAELAQELAEAYERKYDWAVTVGPAGWYAIHPVRAYAWTEASYPATATRFDFG
jgi:Pyridoxamine 5'-phosphate oxidase